MIYEGITNIAFGNSAEKQVNLQKLCPRELRSETRGIRRVVLCQQRPIDNGIEGSLRCHFWNNWEMGEYLYRVKLLTAFHITHLQFLSLEIISNPPLKMTNPCLAREASLRWTLQRLHD